MPINSDQVQPFCSHYEQCGGCSLQHLSEASYRGLKVTRLKQVLAGAGIETTILPLESAPQASRRRTTLVARKLKSGQLALGYHPVQSHEVTDISTCPILVEPLQGFIPQLRLILEQVDFKQADLALTYVDEGVDLQWLGKLSNSQKAELVRLIEAQPLVLRVSCQEEVLFERQSPKTSISGVNVHLPVGAFLQASFEGEQILQRAVTGLCKGTSVADLFCGLGTFSIPLAQQGKQVVAVDTATESLKALRAAGQHLALRVMERDLFKQPLDKDALHSFETVIIDPPRAGAKAQCNMLSQSQVQQIIYVSCNPQTFAQDAQALLAGGYQLHSVLPVDQFVWSNHLEIVADFRRNL